MHLAIDAKTLEIRGIEVTDNSIGDAPMLAGLLAQIPEDEEIGSVCANRAYDTQACHDAIAQRNRASHHPAAQERTTVERQGQQQARYARTFARQVAELQVLVALLNRFTQLGIPNTVTVA